MLAKLSSPFREFGLLGGLLYGTGRILTRLGSGFQVFHYELMAQPVADAPLLPQKFRDMLEVRPIDRGDPAFDLMPPPAHVVESRFAQPTVCLGAYKADRLVAYSWLCLGPYEEDEVRCRFVPTPEGQTAWDFDIYVFPEHRLGIAFLALWDGANRFLSDRGVHTSFSRVSRTNVGSRSAHKHFKWKRVGQAAYLKGKRVQLMVATVAPFVHFSLGESSRPVVRLRT